MGVIRVQHNDNYTTMSNYHLRDSRLSLRAMGLMSKMLSLPDDWDYTVAGLAAICREGREAVRKVLQELEDAGYLERDQSREGGRFSGYDYTLHEEPTLQEEDQAPPEAPQPEEPEPLPAPTPSPRNPGNGDPPSPKKPLPRKPLPENPPQLNNYGLRRHAAEAPPGRVHRKHRDAVLLHARTALQGQPGVQDRDAAQGHRPQLARPVPAGARRRGLCPGSCAGRK